MGLFVTSSLNLPQTENGLIDLSKAEIKSEIIAEILDPTNGAKIEMGPDKVAIETSNTREGLTYEFFESDTIEGLQGTAKETKVGDGSPFKPTIQPNGSKCRFFKIGVKK